MTEGWLRDPRYDALLERLVVLQRQEAALHAERAQVLALLAARTSREGWQAEAPFESLVLDVAGTCVLGQVAAGSRLLDAEHLVVRLPGTLDLLQQGTLAPHQAQVVVGETRELAPEVCAEVERLVLPSAPPLCPADLRRLVRRTVLEVDAAEQARREEEAVARRRVWVKPVEDGMALLCALLPAEQAQQAYRQLTERARTAKAAPGETRSSDELRADLLAETLTSADVAPGRGRGPQVLVHVPLASALGVSDAPADLEGHGPISAAHARRLLEGADLRRACVDPETGEVWAVDGRTRRAERRTEPADRDQGGRRPADPQSQVPTAAPAPVPGPALRRVLLAMLHDPPPQPLPPEPRHSPSAGLARLVRVRDRRCDGIGCSVPASRCELDHAVPWPAGDTSASNLRARSQRCHHAKHAGWSVRTDRGGSIWTSPGGRHYLVPHRAARPPGEDELRRLREVARREPSPPTRHPVTQESRG